MLMSHLLEHQNSIGGHFVLLQDFSVGTDTETVVINLLSCGQKLLSCLGFQILIIHKPYLANENKEKLFIPTVKRPRTTTSAESANSLTSSTEEMALAAGPVFFNSQLTISSPVRPPIVHTPKRKRN